MTPLFVQISKTRPPALILGRRKLDYFLNTNAEQKWSKSWIHNDPKKTSKPKKSNNLCKPIPNPIINLFDVSNCQTVITSNIFS